MAGINLEFSARQQERVLAELRTIRDENGLLHRELAGKASAGMLIVILDRFAEFETETRMRFNQLEILIRKD